MSTTNQETQEPPAAENASVGNGAVEPVPETAEDKLLCPECLANGETVEFQTPQGLSAHRRREHNVEVLLCPECQEKGKYVTFERAQALGSHRARSHGVAGTAAATLRAQAKKKNTSSSPAASESSTKKKMGRPRGGGASTRKSSAVLVPEGLSEREMAAFRLGVLRTLKSAISSGEIPAPAPILMQTFDAEIEYRETQLA